MTTENTTEMIHIWFLQPKRDDGTLRCNVAGTIVLLLLGTRAPNNTERGWDQNQYLQETQIVAVFMAYQSLLGRAGRAGWKQQNGGQTS